ncbi:MAG: hypothetical protein GEU91_16045 [Rhizobiales bacterium]|nr:hypothetical protein [Hyphomicrobiales bacterium]
MSTPLRADLIGEGFLRCGPVSVSGPYSHSSVRTLCERLLRQGFDPRQRLHIFRGASIYERVSSLRDAITSN